jgi:hypothetical protein
MQNREWSTENMQAYFSGEKRHPSIHVTVETSMLRNEKHKGK